MTAAYLYFLSVIGAKTVIVFLFCVTGLRLLGKRQIGQVNIYDLAMVMALANAIQNAMTAGTGNLTTGLVCAGSLFCMARLTTSIFLKWPKVEHNLCGASTVVVLNGRIIDSHMRQCGVTADQLDLSLRAHGFSDLSQVRMGVLEIDGSLSVVPYQPPN